jgi:hypothetical protein|tara:strand:- start:221 stop:343 length:123 start_codon:yes stop_codon:yes gene_type:complete
MKTLQEMLKRILLENTELKKKVSVLEEILRSYLPVLRKKK